MPFGGFLEEMGIDRLEQNKVVRVSCFQNCYLDQKSIKNPTPLAKFPRNLKTNPYQASSPTPNPLLPAAPAYAPSSPLLPSRQEFYISHATRFFPGTYRHAPSSLF